MKCPDCGFPEDRVVESRESREGDYIRRRRECLKCNKRFTTYEKVEEVPVMVVKKDGRREVFDLDKIRKGLYRALEKRPVAAKQIEQIARQVEEFVVSSEREVSTKVLGDLIMDRLKKLDKVAYIRFASVYFNYKNAEDFVAELRALLSQEN